MQLKFNVVEPFNITENNYQLKFNGKPMRTKNELLQRQHWHGC